MSDPMLPSPPSTMREDASSDAIEDTPVPLIDAVEDAPPSPTDALRARVGAQEAALARKNRQLTTLIRIARVISSTLDVDELAERVYAQVSQVLDVGSFSLAVRSPEGDGLTRILVMDEDRRYPGAPVSRPVDPTGARRPRILTAAMLTTLRGVDAPDRYGSGRPSAVVISAPMYAGDTLVGELSIGSYQPGAYTEEDAQFVQAIADQTTVALENARHYQSEVARVAALEELGRLRQEFLATVSHELRTPLTSIIGFTETMLGYWDRLPEARRRDMARKTQAAAGRLNRLVQDLLFVSRIDPRAVTLKPSQVPLAPLVAAATREAQEEYGRRPLDLDIPADLHVYADPHRVEQVLVNLLDNAAKYSAEGAPIAVRAEARDDMAVVRVRDNGQGIDPRSAHRLFTRFGKIDATVRAGRIGTGLGLYIAKQLVEAMGGRVWLESSAATGSTFAFSVPRSATREALGTVGP